MDSLNCIGQISYYFIPSLTSFFMYLQLNKNIKYQCILKLKILALTDSCTMYTIVLYCVGVIKGTARETNFVVTQEVLYTCEKDDGWNLCSHTLWKPSIHLSEKMLPMKYNTDELKTGNYAKLNLCWPSPWVLSAFRLDQHKSNTALLLTTPSYNYSINTIQHW